MRRDVLEQGRRESVAKAAPAPPVIAPLAARARATAPDVSAHLTVADRAAALAGLAETIARVGGRENARRSEDDADIVEVVIPRAAFDVFVRDMKQLGGFTAEKQPPELPASVSISLRITR